MRDPNSPCIFCGPRTVTRRNHLAYSTPDSFPVSPGHSLIVPVRHCASFFDLSPDEIAACMELVVQGRAALDAELEPDGYNIGVNVGRAGGQSVLHVHIHLIPRYAGDHPSPQGGVRQIIPWKADYPRGGMRSDGADHGRSGLSGSDVRPTGVEWSGPPSRTDAKGGQMPHRFLIHAAGDAVGVAAEDVAAGTRATAMVLRDKSVVELVVREPIPLGHKVALRAIARGERVIEYGEVIGEAQADIAVGQHVHVHNLRSVRWPTSTTTGAPAA